MAACGWSSLEFIQPLLLNLGPQPDRVPVNPRYGFNAADAAALTEQADRLRLLCGFRFVGHVARVSARIQFGAWRMCRDAKTIT